MIPLDPKDYINNTGWKIRQEEGTQLYKVFNERGNSLPSLFTSYKQAASALQSYLSKLEIKKYKNKQED